MKRKYYVIGMLMLIVFTLLILSQKQYTSQTKVVIQQSEPLPGEVRSIPKSPAFSRLKHIVSDYKPGKIVFTTPEQMYVGNSKLIQVNITDDLQKNLDREIETVKRINKKINLEESQIKVYSLMKARLEGFDFDIKSLSEDNQLVIPKQVVTWRWRVTPQKAGEKTLILTLYAKLKVNGSDELFSLKTFDRTVKVKVNHRKWFQDNFFQIVEILFGGGLLIVIATNYKAIVKTINSWIKHLHHL